VNGKKKDRPIQRAVLACILTKSVQKSRRLSSGEKERDQKGGEGPGKGKRTNIQNKRTALLFWYHPKNYWDYREQKEYP